VNGTIAFLPSRDLERSAQFFGEVLELRIVEIDPYACIVESPGCTIRIAAATDWEPQAFTVLGWTVADLEEEVDRLVRRGVVFNRYPGMDQDGRGLWTAPSGQRVAWFRDPDANTLSLTEDKAPD
jgi:catechol 2,3-dioxygenase-like lactoylglutathione lyase family enzyme